MSASGYRKIFLNAKSVFFLEKYSKFEFCCNKSPFMPSKVEKDNPEGAS